MNISKSSVELCSKDREACARWELARDSQRRRYRLTAESKNCIMLSATYSLSAGPIPLWFPKKNEFLIINLEFFKSPTTLQGICLATGWSAKFPAIIGRV